MRGCVSDTELKGQQKITKHFRCLDVRRPRIKMELNFWKHDGYVSSMYKARGFGKREDWGREQVHVTLVHALYDHRALA